MVMNILTSANSHYIKYVYVMMESVMSNSDEPVIFYLATSTDVNKKQIEELSEYVTNRGHKLENITINEKLPFKTTTMFPIASYYYVMCIHSLPENLDRVLCLDVDIIVNKNISDLFHMDFDNRSAIVASQSIDFERFNKMEKKEFAIEKMAKGYYFNAGMILLNLKKIKSTFTPQNIIKTYEEIVSNYNKKPYDQDLMNYILAPDSKYVYPIEYNCRVSQIIKKEKGPYKSEGNLDEYFSKIKIIHYTMGANRFKPWDLLLEKDDEFLTMCSQFSSEGADFYFSDELLLLHKVWWKYAEKTPVYNLLIVEMNAKTEWFNHYLKEHFYYNNGSLSQSRLYRLLNYVTTIYNSIRK